MSPRCAQDHTRASSNLLYLPILTFIACLCLVQSNWARAGVLAQRRMQFSSSQPVLLTERRTEGLRACGLDAATVATHAQVAPDSVPEPAPASPPAADDTAAPAEAAEAADDEAASFGGSKGGRKKKGSRKAAVDMDSAFAALDLESDQPPAAPPEPAAGADEEADADEPAFSGELCLRTQHLGHSGANATSSRGS